MIETPLQRMRREQRERVARYVNATRLDNSLMPAEPDDCPDCLLLARLEMATTDSQGLSSARKSSSASPVSSCAGV
jgi:hypothetical protein